MKPPANEKELYRAKAPSAQKKDFFFVPPNLGGFAGVTVFDLLVDVRSLPIFQ
jgi:hypothetical protein